MFYYLYEIKNNLNGKIYIGVHKTKSLEDGYMGSGKVISNAIRKYGIENFTKHILETFDTSEAMYAREAAIVTDEFLLREDVYNLRRGGHGGFEYINNNKLTDAVEAGRKGGKSFSENLKTNNKLYDTFSKMISKRNVDRHKNCKAYKFSAEDREVVANMCRGKIWINDGIRNIRVNSDDVIPDGFKRGLFKRRKSE